MVNLMLDLNGCFLRKSSLLKQLQMHNKVTKRMDFFLDLSMNISVQLRVLLMVYLKKRLHLWLKLRVHFRLKLS